MTRLRNDHLLVTMLTDLCEEMQTPTLAEALSLGRPTQSFMIEVLESFVTKTRDKEALLKFLKKTLKRHRRRETMVPDRLHSYVAALKGLGIHDCQETDRWANNRAENSHQSFRRREKAMLRFRRMRTLQTFPSVHASVHKHFNQERALYGRQDFRANLATAETEWRGLLAA